MKLTFDLHFHSCLSPCGDSAMTPASIAGFCRLAGLDVAALTDHNTCGNCAAFCRAAQAYGIMGLPGMELCTAEEVHVVCVFPRLRQAEAFEAEVRRRLQPIRNRPKVFGRQLLMDEEDRVLGEEELLLAGASQVPLHEVRELAERFGGAAWPAHIDRPSFSILSNLGLWMPELGFSRAEISSRCPADFRASRPDLTGVSLIRGCDAHYVEQIADAHQAMEVPEATPEAVICWLRQGKEPEKLV